MLSIIIPVFNQSSYTKACIEALALTCGAPDSYEIVIVDNCSSDDTPQIIEAFCKLGKISIQYIRNEQNLGFTRGSNQGAASAKGDLFVFLNNDTIPQPGWRENLENALIDPKNGIVGPRLLYPNTLEVNHAGYVYNPKIGGFYSLYQSYPGNFAGVLKERNFQALLGACLMMHRATFEKLNGFSEIGLEDIDLCLRVRELGKEVRYIPTSVVYHHGSVTQKNSAVGSIPIYSSEDFSKRWLNRGLKWDDFNFYIEDQILTPIAIEDANRSYLLLEEALKFIKDGFLDNAAELLNQSIAIYPGNTDALSEILILAIDRADKIKVHESCLKILEQGASFGEALAFVAIFYRKIGMLQEMREVVLKIQALKWCSSDTRDLASEMLA